MPTPGFAAAPLADPALAGAGITLLDGARPVYTAYPFLTGRLAVLDRVFPSSLHAWDRGKLILHDREATHFGYVHEGLAVVSHHGRQHVLYEGMYFVLPGALTVEGTRGVVISREGYRGLPLFGGPLEQTGRLKYIDGCTDSLLASPVRRGDPCLNLLYFPPGIDQTGHTHPSDRIGLILSGHGRCVVGHESPSTIDLVPGQIFCIHTDGYHLFQTPYGADLRVLAYHPDSDFGPTDQDHPMINRTLVAGVPASQIAAIQTR